MFRFAGIILLMRLILATIGRDNFCKSIQGSPNSYDSLVPQSNQPSGSLWIFRPLLMDQQGGATKATAASPQPRPHQHLCEMHGFPSLRGCGGHCMILWWVGGCFGGLG